ncbi:MAG: bifunctional NAD(P)H-hydrate repair enzyme Nnr [Bacteroidia bacterium]|nr:MAG: bifunctional NAD(P)H-hydrate repair enzyme Nnr [Bacteroidia bacterium]
MAECDREAMRAFGISGQILMENAGAGIARWLSDRFAPIKDKTVCIFSGKGNNGGDGFVVARHLANAGARVHVFVWSRSQRGDAAKNFDILRRFSRAAPDEVSIAPASPSKYSSLRPDLIIDSVFGTGFSGAVKPEYRKVLQWMNAQSVPRIAVDIPSGVNGTTGKADRDSIRATVTLTLGTVKRGLLCNEGRDRSGEIHVIDIGIPRSVFLGRKPQTFLMEMSDVKTVMPARASTVHKYGVGKVFVLAGSTGYTGAAALTTRAALRSGAGAVVLGTPSSVYPVLARVVTEAIVVPLPSTQDGSLSLEAEAAVLERMEWADVCVVGPGLSRNNETSALVRSVLRKARGRIVADADALNILGRDWTKTLKRSSASFVLTPHAGEASRLLGITSEDIEEHRVDVAREAARRFDATFVLKGAPTATASPNGTVFLNSTGNPGMATVGAGDVLAGIIGALWAQGMERSSAAWAGVYLHGLAGDLAATRLGEKSLVAGDLIDVLPAAFRQVEVGM